MRLRISVGDADVEEIYVLRVTLSLVSSSAGLIDHAAPQRGTGRARDGAVQETESGAEATSSRPEITLRCKLLKRNDTMAKT
jgi:hypothetical protein